VPPRDHAGVTDAVLVADRDVRILTRDGALVRHLTGGDYQPQSLNVAV
jgi:hypothetical protein